MNFGLGLEHQLSDRFTLYGGAARNASTWTPESEHLASWDLVDVTAGVSLNRGRSRLAFGLGYAWGSGDLPQAIVPPDATGQRADDRGEVQPLDDLARRVPRRRRPVGGSGAPYSDL